MLRTASKNGVLVSRMSATLSQFSSNKCVQIMDAAEASTMPVVYQPHFSSTYVTTNLFKNVQNAGNVAQEVQKKNMHSSSKVSSAAVEATAEVDAVDMYSLPMRYIHWIMAAGIISVIGLLQMARGTDDPKAKGFYMMLHKSIGFTLGFVTLARVFLRAHTKMPVKLAGSSLEHFGAYLSHQTLYILMLFMPFTGILMGYYGGKGIPFFGLTIPGASDKNKDGDIAKMAFKTHRVAGQVFYYLLPLHFGAAAYHQFYHAQQIFRRVNPLAMAKVAA